MVKIQSEELVRCPKCSSIMKRLTRKETGAVTNPDAFSDYFYCVRCKRTQYVVMDI